MFMVILHEISIAKIECVFPDLTLWIENLKYLCIFIESRSGGIDLDLTSVNELCSMNDYL